jgi:hypothetical protein
MNPLLTTILTVALLDLIVLVLVWVLFKYLNSQATAEGAGEGLKGWKAQGAIAGFIILMGLQLVAVKYLTPASLENHNSYPTMKSFCDGLKEKHYEQAWQALSSEFQEKRWSGNIENFKRGFVGTKNIYRVAVAFESSLSEYSDRYVLYYKDESETPVLSGLESVWNQRVEDLPNIQAGVNTWRGNLESAGLPVDALDKMKLSHLLTAIRGDILRWNIENQKSPIPPGFFTNKQIVSRFVGKAVTVEKKDGKWKISQIDDLPYNEE